jgi:hypothetical protein
VAARIEVREVKVAELRRGLRALLKDEKPLVVMRNRTRCAVVLCLKGSWWSPGESMRAERRRLRAELEAVLRALPH